MTDNPEQESLRQLIERHQNGDSENDIRTAFQNFIAAAAIATPAEMSTEVPPGIGTPGRMDLYIHNTCIEFKRNILNQGAPRQEYIQQLDGYLKGLLKAGRGGQNGILTDGVNFFQRRIGDAELPLLSPDILRNFTKPEQAANLREYLHGIISAPARNISPTAENLKRHFGIESDPMRAATLLLQDAYKEHRENPSVAVKRRLWQDLLQVALGRNAADAGNESDWLFIRHTYITSLIAVIMQQQLLGDVARHAAERPDALLKGRILAEQSDLHGIIDADLFTWPTEVNESQYLREIARIVEQFDWTQDSREVAPTLYQNVITQEERKRLGEYYTPRWLAQEITAAVVDDPLQQRVLDPACGSGTFIETAVERILEHAGELSATEKLQKLQTNIVGIDIHPVAVQLAKATWVMAAKDTIRAARAEGANAVSAPIYLGDSMQLRYATGTLQAQQSIELATGETLPGYTEPITFSIPKELARQQANIDQLISEMANDIDAGGNAEHLADSYKLSDDCRQSVKTIAAQMQELHAADRNHVWAYYIRNMVRPAVIAEEKVDRIIGNPPWLTYSQSADIIRAELREMSNQRYQIWAGGKMAPHQDIATLFYTRCAELYAKGGTRIGMVMPHSVLRAGQHLKWRGGSYHGKTKYKAIGIGLDLQKREPWDLDNVKPDFFPMPGSVVFGEYIDMGIGKPMAPGTVQMWNGNWAEDYAGISRQQDALQYDDGKFKSPYAQLSSNGATILDRRLFFIEMIPHTAMLPAANTTKVRPHQTTQDKTLYTGQLTQLEGVVHNDHIFDVYLGESIAPYVALAPLQAALPVHRSTMTIPLNHAGCRNNKHNACQLEINGLHSSMQRRWNNAAELFRETHKNQAIKELYNNLNHLNKLTRQLEYLQEKMTGKSSIRVAYPQCGKPTATIIRDDQAIVDYRLFQTIVISETEAHYILAILNSNTLAKAAETFMPKGLYGARDFQKHGWKLPIPRYDATEPLHVNLAELGATAEQECQNLIAQSDILSKAPGDPQSRAARKLLRHEWQPNSATAQAIETAVAQLLNDPAQAALAQRQMAAAKTAAK